MKWVRFSFILLGIVAAITIGMVAWESDRGVSAMPGSPWGDKQVRVVSRTQTTPTSNPDVQCGGSQSSIRLGPGTATRSACVYGSYTQLQLARYSDSSSSYSYAVSFPFDANFYPIRNFCAGKSLCMYSPDTDTLVIEVSLSGGGSGIRLVRNFANEVKKVATDTYATWGEGYIDYSEISAGGRTLPVKAAAFSENGKWLVVELPNYGIVHVNSDTFEMRRIKAPGADYGHGIGFLFELAVSNDGRAVAIMGKNAGMRIVEVDDFCGDSLGFDPLPGNFPEGTVGCRNASIDTYALFPSFSRGMKPRFSQDGKYLQVTVSTAGGVEDVVLTAIGSHSPPESSYVALGDSYTSGEGESEDAYYLPWTNSDTNKCHVSDRSYPYLVGAFWSVNTETRACSGATTKDVLMGSSDLDAQINALQGLPVSVVSIGIGGNDSGLMAKLKSCLGLDTCEWAKPGKYRAGSANEIDRLSVQVDEVVKKVKELQPSAAVLLVGYPKIINSSSSAKCDALIGAMLNGDERKFMDKSIERINAVLKTVAADNSSHYIDTEDAYTGKRLCDEGAAAMNGIRLGDDIAPIGSLPRLKIIGAESFHPTAVGHSLVASRLLSRFPTVESIGSCSSCSGSGQLGSDYWVDGLAEGMSGYHQAMFGLTNLESYRYGDIVQVETPGGLLAPDSEFSIELHSDVAILGGGNTNSDGSVGINLWLPGQGRSGYHTLHLLGISASGRLIDLYSTVWVEGEQSDQEDVYIGDGSEGNNIGISQVIIPVASAVTGGSLRGSIVDGFESTLSRASVNELSDSPRGNSVAVLGDNSALGDQSSNVSSSRQLGSTSSVSPFPVVYYVTIGLITLVVAVVIAIYFARRAKS